MSPENLLWYYTWSQACPCIEKACYWTVFYCCWYTAGSWRLCLALYSWKESTVFL